MQHSPPDRSQNHATIEAVIFDLDGTLVDSNDFHVKAWDLAFRHFGKEFPMAKLRANIGKGSDQYLPEFLNPEELETSGKEIDQYRSRLFRTQFLSRIKPFPGVRELLERIKIDGRRIALATSSKKDDAKTYTDIAGITDLVDCLITADDAEESKPSPAVFQVALNKLQLIGPQAVAVGDTVFDIEAAKQIDLPTIALLCGRAADEETLRRTGAIAVYKDPADLLDHYEESPLYEPKEQLASSR
ncbi:MAG: HAD family hydrolase [Chthoniobacterales bacterium]